MRVRTNQTDLNGVMYHGAYFDCFEAARIDTFRNLGYTYQQTLVEGFVPVIRRVSCEYLGAAYLDDQIEVTVHVGAMSAATLLLRYDAQRSEAPLAAGEALFAFLDRSGHPIRVPISLRRCVQQHETLLTPEPPSPRSRSGARGRPARPSSRVGEG